MRYLILGFIGVSAGFRALTMRRKQLSGTGGPPRSVFRPGFLAVLGGVGIATGFFLLVAAVVDLVQGRA
ncbi:MULTISPECIES: hypothetical protein [unclassified Streptomyces]|uniref:hypothetical protein n=1 Tax=unclassified Streptomyces TaxID=2593676 RepID=UPI00339E4130